MHVGIYDADSKIPNFALMKITRYHRQLDDEVEAFNPLNASTYNKIYASKLFDFSPAPYLSAKMDIGGTGWSSTKNLPDEIETLTPDYHLYPDFVGNIGYTMRGCRSKCKFCVVPEKEGRAVSVATIDDLMVNNSEFLVLLDNDPFGNPDWRDRFGEIGDRGLRVNLSQGVNIRTLTDEQAEALASIHYTNLRQTRRTVFFAWDNPKDERRILAGIERCLAAGIKAWHMGFYVMIGFSTSPEEDLHRIETLKKFSIRPFVMPYRKKDPYQRAFAQWVNRPAKGKSYRYAQFSDFRTGYWPF